MMMEITWKIGCLGLVGRNHSSSSSSSVMVPNSKVGSREGLTIGQVMAEVLISYELRLFFRITT